MSKQEEIIEVAGKKVVVRYARTQEEACASCVLCSRKECNYFDCNIRDIIGESVCRYSYFVEAEETHSLQEWAQILATNPDLRAEFDKMCPPQPIRGSIVPEVDFDELIKQEMVKVYETYTRPDYIEENTTEAAYDFDMHIARHFYDLNPKHNGFKWHKFSEQLPPLGVPVLAFHHNWINADFNPEGIRIGHLQENCSSYDGKYDFCSAHWWDYQDCFVTISKSDVEGKEQGFSEDIVNSIMPEYWVELPMFNHKHK